MKELLEQVRIAANMSGWYNAPIGSTLRNAYEALTKEINKKEVTQTKTTTKKKGK